ncbi:MAG: hypothetical protein HQL11_01810 [Candidatus Omnitrophica bacterium]|nr:hypothetical protein [Candidatus Omnitrophota bacterium]
MKRINRWAMTAAGLFLTAVMATPAQAALDAASRDTILDGLMGAGTGAIAAGASGGKAGTGALIGAGTNLVGRVLINLLSTPSTTYSTQPAYAYPQTYSYVPAPEPPPTSGNVVYAAQPFAAATPVTVQPVYQTTYPAAVNYGTRSTSSAENSKRLITQGLMGAATGAIASEASGGKAGTGALIGAGTQLAGNILIDLLQPAPAATPVATQRITPNPAWLQTSGSGPVNKKIVRTYDADGKLVSEEEFWI